MVQYSTIYAHDKNNWPYCKCAFNTQACEQLNPWFGGFESIIKQMTTGNFNWYLHAMLFYHTMFVLKKQARKAEKTARDNGGNNDSGNDSDNNSDSDIENGYA